MKKSLNACILLKVIPTKAEKIINSIREIENIRKAYFSYGRFDIVIFVKVVDYKELRTITSQINDLDGVRSTETLAEA
jgi:hypothetical protein